MLGHAFKEWAAICAALGQGRQALILRKGGIAEEAGEFRVAVPRFWLYPTYVHQQRAGIKPDALGLLDEAERTRPAPGQVRLSHWCEATGVYRLHDLLPARLLDHLHLWSDETVQKRFHYRVPGLTALTVRVHQAPAAVTMAETPAYAGCKSWVELDGPLSTDGSTPVLDDEHYQHLVRQIDMILRPSARA